MRLQFNAQGAKEKYSLHTSDELEKYIYLLYSWYKSCRSHFPQACIESKE